MEEQPLTNFFGVRQESTQPLETRVSDIMQHLGLKPRIMVCTRLGKEQEGSVRLIKVTLSSSLAVSEVLWKSKMLKDTAQVCRQIFICLDRTVKQRKAQRGLVDQLKKLKTEHLGAKYCIRRGKVVQCENSQP